MDDFEGTSHDMWAQAAFWPSAYPNPHTNISNFKDLRQNLSHVIVSEDWAVQSFPQSTSKPDPRSFTRLSERFLVWNLRFL